MKHLLPVVGVRELRTHLSAYLRVVAQGGSVTIASRGRRPMARLVPAEPAAEDEVLARLAAQGAIQRGMGKPRPRPRIRLRRPGPLASDVVLEDRG